MGETIVIMTLIIASCAVTIFATIALLALRKREQSREDTEKIAKTIDDLDAALDAALTEINRMGALVQKEVDEKYQAVLFLYDLVEDKKKEITEAAEEDVISEIVARYLETHGAALNQAAEASRQGVTVVDGSRGHHGIAGQSRNDGRLVPPNNGVFTDLPEQKSEAAATPLAFKRPTFSNPRHKEIWEMREQGRNVPDIAKELGMGQGEVKLILDLADMAS